MIFQNACQVWSSFDSLVGLVVFMIIRPNNHYYRQENKKNKRSLQRKTKSIVGLLIHEYYQPCILPIQIYFNIYNIVFKNTYCLRPRETVCFVDPRLSTFPSTVDVSLAEGNIDSRGSTKHTAFPRSQSISILLYTI